MVIKRIGIVAPAARLDPAVAERVRLMAAAMADGPELVIHPQCYLSEGHFAGPDAARAEAFLDVANDPDIDALWVARGGYGSCRIAEAVLGRLNDAAREKVYLGYSDAGFLLAGLYAKGCRVAHGPMPMDLNRQGGEGAVARALSWFAAGDSGALEASLDAETPTCAFNMVILSHLLGTSLEPDLRGHVLMLEEVSEHLYRIDRTMFHLTAHPALRQVAGIKLGRVNDIIPNDPVFAETEEEIVMRWCRQSGIAYLGRADIGHDADNKIVPFGLFRRP
ncbi:muramoyltetrapeptide carboxypeptidase [Rhizomicrobium palustre]|uniref:Muramoyltetrapeptide carboxypeptidase n=1 Tax=Rhizomicrobium palustre TaxID=189966 RepID=A0A846MXU7_9PROT|nr:LD-carboxypeptidase [Rhizomicrobium palustre]NIK88418.1 muramoyltetrapeptide carboxypeptidase [Rhizomicrobium palustre]